MLHLQNLLFHSGKQTFTIPTLQDTKQLLNALHFSICNNVSKQVIKYRME